MKLSFGTFKCNYKKFILVLLLLIPVSMLSQVTLVKQHDRAGSIALPDFIKAKIRKETKDKSVAYIIKYSNRLTASTLYFSDHCSKVTFRKETPAHCVLYAKTYSTILNYSFKVNHIKAHSSPVVGYFKIFGINVCKCLSSIPISRKFRNFTKDHDFVEISYHNDILYIDPSAYDILGCSFRQYKK
jgi:hypothetical protein